MVLKKEMSRDSGVQTDDDSLYDSESFTPLLHNSKHVQYDVQNESADKADLHVTQKPSNEKSIFSLTSLTLEPFMFLFMFSYIIRATCITNMMIDKICLYHLNYSQEICSNLSNHTTIKDEVEKMANTYSQYMQLIHMGPGALAMIFIGPWSDRFGRKPPLYITIIGTILDNVGVILNTVYYEAPVGYLLLASVPSGITGGFICIMSTMFSMASEMTTEKTRTIKYAIIELSFGTGMALGGLAGGLIYKYYSYLTVFEVALTGSIITLPWAVFVIQETQGLNLPPEIRWWDKFRGLFSLKNLDEGFKTFMKRRPNHGRAQLWLLLAAVCALVLTLASFASMSYIYTFHMYNWDVTRYNTVNTVFTCIGLVVGTVCVPLLIRTFKVGDSFLGLVGSISMTTKNACLAFATYTWLYYLGNLAGMLGIIGTLAVRSRISKLVDKDELGKAFTFLSSCESLVPLVGTIVITNIYNATLEFFPGMCYLIAAILLFPSILSFAWMSRLKNCDNASSETSVLENGDLPCKT